MPVPWTKEAKQQELRARPPAAPHQLPPPQEQIQPGQGHLGAQPGDGHIAQQDFLWAVRRL